MSSLIDDPLIEGADFPALSALALIGRGLDDFATASLWAATARELATLVIGLERVSRRVSAAQTRLSAQADASRVADHEGATSTAAWLRNVADVPIGEGKARLALHEALGRRPVVGAAFTAGDVGLAAAAAICGAVDGLPPAVPAALETEIESLLVDVARAEGTKSVIRRGAEIVHRFAPDHLEEDEEKQVERRNLRLVSRHDGSLSIHGLVDREAGELVMAVLGPLAAPRASSDGIPDLRDGGRRYADALVQLCQTGSGQLADVRGERPQVVVTIDFEALLGKLGRTPAQLESGKLLSPAAARRIACDARIIPVMLGANSEPLDVGRSAYTATRAVRRAVVARDGGCVFPACDRPPSWCDVHHVQHWCDGGSTSVGNLALLCDRHHRAVHHDGWLVQMTDAKPWFIPPAWVDPSRTPRLHSRFIVTGRLMGSGPPLVSAWLAERQPHDDPPRDNQPRDEKTIGGASDGGPAADP
jgi:hypothetical protein